MPVLEHDLNRLFINHKNNTALSFSTDLVNSMPFYQKQPKLCDIHH